MVCKAAYLSTVPHDLMRICPRPHIITMMHRVRAAAP
jgi:hypothetical protein